MMLFWLLLLFGGVTCSLRKIPNYGFIKSPNFPRTYPRGNHSTWDITVPEGFHISLKFLVFHLKPSDGCSYEYVKVWADKRELGRFCGSVRSSSHPGQRLFTSKGNQMKIEFHSDFSNEERGSHILYPRFQAFYKAMDNDECLNKSDSSSTWTPPCQHTCHNYIGGYFCSCFPGYKLQSDNRSCRVCGKRPNLPSQTSRVIGGKIAAPGSFPWQVYVKASDKGGGGVLIGEQWILTAAHVIKPIVTGNKDSDVQNLYIYVGETSTEKIQEEHRLPVKTFHMHPEYVDVINDNDIALIELKDPVIMNDNVSTICLPEKDEETLYEPDRLGYVSGFGYREKDMISRDLRYVKLPMVQRDKCEQELYAKKQAATALNKVLLSKFTENMFCAGNPENSQVVGDSCHGDSGGPFAVQNKDKWVLIGLVSWGVECGEGYGYYTKVIRYIDWIKDHIGR